MEKQPRAAEEAELRAAFYAAMRSIGEKELDRSALVEGANYELTLAIAGNLGLLPFCECMKATVNVGHSGTTPSTAAPPPAHLVAWLMTKLEPDFREQLLKDLPQQFARNKRRLPKVDPAFHARVEQMLKRMRAMTSTDHVAKITCNYHIEDGTDGTE